MAKQGDVTTKNSEMIGQFKRNATTAGALVSVVSGAAAAAAVIAGIASGSAKCSAAVREYHPDLYNALHESGFTLTAIEDITPGDEDRSTLAASLAGGVGIVAGRAGVAETGSVLLADDSLAPRLLGMLVDVCIIVLPRESILGDLDEAGVLISEMDRRGHRYLSLVTGPSRTADIERVLTIGMQGPKALHVVVF